MRFLPLSVSFVLAAALPALGQVSVEILLDEPEFLRDESLVLRVRVTNRAGQPLQLGQSNDWLSFAVQGNDGSAVTQLADPAVAGVFTVESAQSATKSVDLMPCFDFPEAARYTVSATVRIPQWSGEVTSAPKSFHIIRGARLWEEEFGIPTRQGTPEARKYSLVRANGLKQQRLYVRVTDPEEHKVFRVVPVGPMVSFGQPEAQVDRTSILHLLFQNGARTFVYGSFNPRGEWMTRQTFDYSASRPALRVNDQGKVLVAGGVRRFLPSDLPPPPKATADTNEVPVPSVLAAPPPVKDAKPAKP